MFPIRDRSRRRALLDIGKEIPYLIRMITSKLTSKAQTTIPLPVRHALRLSEGDQLAYEIDGDRVVLRKAERGAIEDPFATFSEWSSPADTEGYAKL